MERLRAAILGASHWHFPLYEAPLRRRFDILSVLDDSGRDSAVAGRFSARSAASIEDAISDSPDVVFVLLPHDRMAEAAHAVTDAGIPVVLEKPGAVSLAELNALANAAAGRAVPVWVPLIHRYAPFMAALRESTDPRYLSISYLVGPPSRYPLSGNDWMLDPARSGGGVLVNLGAHFVDVFTELTGAPVIDVRARGHSSLHGLSFEDHASLLLTSSAGHTATLDLGYTFPDSPSKRHVSITLSGTDAFVAIDPDGAARVTRPDGSASEMRLDLDSDNLFAPFIDDVANALEGSESAGPPTIVDLLAAMATINSAYGDMAGSERDGTLWQS